MISDDQLFTGKLLYCMPLQGLYKKPKLGDRLKVVDVVSITDDHVEASYGASERLHLERPKTRAINYLLDRDTGNLYWLSSMEAFDCAKRNLILARTNITLEYDEQLDALNKIQFKVYEETSLMELNSR